MNKILTTLFSMKKKLFIVVPVLAFLFTGCQQTAKFPLTDLHIHIKGGFTIEDAVRKSEAEKIQYGIAVNCGLGFPVQNDFRLTYFCLQ